MNRRHAPIGRSLFAGTLIALVITAGARPALAVEWSALVYDASARIESIHTGGATPSMPPAENFPLTDAGLTIADADDPEIALGVGRTDAAGRMALDLGPIAPGTRVFLRAERGDQRYRSDVVTVTESMPSNVRVFRESTDRTKLRQVGFVILWDRDESSIAVRQVVQIENATFETIVAGETPTLVLPIPENATIEKLTLNEQPIDPVRHSLADRPPGIAFDFNVTPTQFGRDRPVVLAEYWIPAPTEGEFMLEFPADLPTSTFRLAIEPTDLHYNGSEVDGVRLESSGTLGRDQGMPRDVRVWSGSEILIGEVVRLPLVRGSAWETEVVPARLVVTLFDASQQLRDFQARQGDTTNSPPARPLSNAEARVELVESGRSFPVTTDASGRLEVDLGDQPRNIELRVAVSDFDGQSYLSRPQRLDRFAGAVPCYERGGANLEGVTQTVSLIVTDDSEVRTEESPNADGTPQQVVDPPEPRADGTYRVQVRQIIQIQNFGFTVFEGFGDDEVIASFPLPEGATVTSLTDTNGNAYTSTRRELGPLPAGIPVPGPLVPGQQIQLIGTYELALRDGESFDLDVTAGLPTQGVQLGLGVGRFHYFAADHPEAVRLATSGRMGAEQGMSKDVQLLSYGAVASGRTLPIKLHYGERPVHESTWRLTAVILGGILLAIVAGVVIGGRRSRARSGDDVRRLFDDLERRRSRGELDDASYFAEQRRLAAQFAPGGSTTEVTTPTPTGVGPGAIPTDLRDAVVAFTRRYGGGDFTVDDLRRDVDALRERVAGSVDAAGRGGVAAEPDGPDGEANA